jgi:hypothetical protein
MERARRHAWFEDALILAGIPHIHSDYTQIPP